MRLLRIGSILLLTLTLMGCHLERAQHGHPVLPNRSGLDSVIQQVQCNVQEIWGYQGLLLPSPKSYVHYSNDAKTRSYVDFEKGLGHVETVNEHKAPQSITAELEELLLSKGSTTPCGERMCLAGQMINQRNQVITHETACKQYIQYLIAHQLRKIYFNKKTIVRAEFRLSKESKNVRQRNFLPYINRSAKKHRIDRSLILAIIEVESLFNPCAVSHCKAIGLMQVQAHTAGADVFKYIYAQPGKPSEKSLLQPEYNIDIGTAYLHILKYKYLKEVKNPLSAQYLLIFAYNGGIGSALKLFHKKDRKLAIRSINRSTPKQIYSVLTSNKANPESREYLKKVASATKRYRHGGGSR